MREHTRPRSRPRVRGDASSAVTSHGYISQPRPLQSSPLDLTPPTTPPQPVKRARGALGGHHCRHGRRGLPPKLARSRPPPSLIPSPENSARPPDPPHLLAPHRSTLQPRSPTSPEAISARVNRLVALILLGVRVLAEWIHLVLLSSSVGRAPRMVAGIAGEPRRGELPFSA